VFVAQGSVEDMVMSGVNRLLSMQTPRGGFGVWPGETEPVPWGTAYVTHILMDAQKRGFAVPQQRIDDAVAYLASEVENVESGSAGSFDFKYHMASDAWEPYVHYVLALAGKGRKARIERLIGGRGAKGLAGQEAENVYLLKAALYLAGDHRYESDLKKPDVSAITDVRSWDYSYYSDARRRGFVLNILTDLFGSDPSGEPLASLIASHLASHGHGYYTTQEVVWSVSGLGKRIGSLASRWDAPKLLANGKVVAAQPNAKSADRTWSLARASEYASVALDVPRADGKLYLIVSSEGVRENAKYELGGNGLSVNRTWRNLDGEVIRFDGAHGLGDMVFSEITLTNTGRERITNIALVDRFPSGWEIENPRLGRGVAVGWVDTEQLWAADYLDVKDDRMQMFGALSPGQSVKVVYTLRAVTAGKFTAPPVEAEAMYDGRIWARDAGEAIDIAGPWAKYVD
jgi:alpha-2-macroglobulin